ncbi:MAG: hypothetical protein K8L97_19620 [Anaerolineae bacterium]|nr:hypothetical protein [Anaerolineae bacterium]
MKNGKLAGAVRASLIAGGLLYLLTGVALLFAPEWFFQNIGYFPPFNRHYEGDLGAFLLPLGAAMLWAAREPAKHGLLVGMAAAGSILHAVNHIVDDLNAGLTLTQWLTSQTFLLLIFGIILAAGYWQIHQSGKTSAAKTASPGSITG